MSDTREPLTITLYEIGPFPHMGLQVGTVLENEAGDQLVVTSVVTSQPAPKADE
jgi:hypothetical protein